ncbi:hypothetical protein JET18_20480 [Chryseobacterium sp. L7]|uniref:Uncharacterized protein n=1 Tax=Chryseobacterium endalhagicum TaxID=2797638 RepID=A0ABS1QLL3_9FLAO|nr:hypothetical protein [Chryseobacterium endalhagicum]MBL1223232.1 hypothetical protein [Chryseobacterium endalhagicum]
MITEIEQQTMDMDWFFTDAEYVGFMASGGGKLPDSVAESEEKRQILVHYFRNLPEISEVEVSSKLDSILIKISGSGADERYLEDYVSMTKKGLYSFDKSYPNQFSEPYYHLVAGPENPLKLNELPQDILDILVKTQYSHKLMEVQEINRLEIN